MRSSQDARGLVHAYDSNENGSLDLPCGHTGETGERGLEGEGWEPADGNRGEAGGSFGGDESKEMTCRCELLCVFVSRCAAADAARWCCREWLGLAANKKKDLDGLETAFRAFDKDEDGFVSYGEIGTFSQDRML